MHDIHERITVLYTCANGMQGVMHVWPDDLVPVHLSHWHRLMYRAVGWPEPVNWKVRRSMLPDYVVGYQIIE